MSEVDVRRKSLKEDHKLDNPYESGSARYGNFVNYYGFNPAENRIRLLPNYVSYISYEDNLVCLDVGCNTGELSQALHTHLLTKLSATEEAPICNMLAVDLDESLINRATAMNKNQALHFSCVNVLSDKFDTLIKSYLEKHQKQVFDIVYCFSITMWIHINHGDEGLRTFLKKLGEVADLLVVEPQPWTCYGKAVRRLKRANSEPFSQFNNLKIRKEVELFITNVLIGDCNFRKVLESNPTSWGRQIHFYKKIFK